MKTEVGELPALLLDGEYANFSLHYCEHRSYYRNVSEEIEDGGHGLDHWVNEKQKQSAVADNSCWYIQVYPHTPVGFYTVAAHTLDALLQYLKEQAHHD